MAVGCGAGGGKAEPEDASKQRSLSVNAAGRRLSGSLGRPSVGHGLGSGTREAVGSVVETDAAASGTIALLAVKTSKGNNLGLSVVADAHAEADGVRGSLTVDASDIGASADGEVRLSDRAGGEGTGFTILTRRSLGTDARSDGTLGASRTLGASGTSGTDGAVVTTDTNLTDKAKRSRGARRSGGAGGAGRTLLTGNTHRGGSARVCGERNKGEKLHI